MAVTDKQLKQLEKLTQRIHRLRGLLGDKTSPAQLIIRKKGAHGGAFRRRREQLRRLEIQRANLLVECVGDGNVLRL